MSGKRKCIIAVSILSITIAILSCSLIIILGSFNAAVSSGFNLQLIAPQKDVEATVSGRYGVKTSRNAASQINNNLIVSNTENQTEIVFSKEDETKTQSFKSIVVNISTSPVFVTVYNGFYVIYTITNNSNENNLNINLSVLEISQTDLVKVAIAEGKESAFTWSDNTSVAEYSLEPSETKEFAVEIKTVEKKTAVSLNDLTIKISMAVAQ